MLRSLYAKTLLLVALAAVGGIGAAYASSLTLVVVAIVFIIGLWLLFRDAGAAIPDIEEYEEPPRFREVLREPIVDWAVSIYLLIWWLILISPLATYEPREVGSRAVETTASGSLQNQLMVVSFGLVGMLFLPAALRRIDRVFWWFLGLWALYMVWCYTTLFWSVYPAATVRNLVAFALVSAGCFGLGAGFYGSRPDGAKLFIKHLTIAGFLSALVVLIPLPFNLDVFNPLDPGQRVEISGNFATFVSRPTMLAALTLILASILGLRRWRNYDWLALLLLLLPVMALKTRGPVLWAMLTLGIVYLICKSGVRHRVFQAGLLLTAGLGYYVFSVSGFLASLSPYFTRDNTELSMNLTGRVPLWEILWPAVEQRPLLGSGFVAFWSPENLYIMERTVGFPVVSAHNGFLEELLNTGAVGLVLFMTFWISAMILAVSRARKGDALGWLAFLYLVFYLFLNITTSLMQEYLEPVFMVVFVIFGLMSATQIEKMPHPPPESNADRKSTALMYHD